MKQATTDGIVLTRTQYGEADRIVTLLTPDHGKIRAIAKGVRRPKSKLAAGVELFCVAQLGFIRGRSELATLTSTRVQRQLEHITQDIDRTMYGYDVLKCINTITEDEAGRGYYDLLLTTLTTLDTLTIPLAVASTWFDLHILRLTGHQPNLHTDTTGNTLDAHETYVFSYDDMCFAPSPAGSDDARLIKFLRLAIATDSPMLLTQVSDVDELLPQAKNLASTMRKHTLKV